MMKLLRAADRIVTPWKNGGGVTREVAVSPPNAGMDDFDWRVSIAEVREAGPFSRFAGIDRTLTILEGRIVLQFADRTVALAEESAPFCFAGDEACDGTPMDGAVTDLNVMVRRGRFTAKVERLTGEAQRTLGRKAILVACGPVRVQHGSEVVSLGRFDAMLFDAPQQLSLRGHVVLIELAEA